MKKRVVAGFLSIILSLSLTVTTFAADMQQPVEENSVVEESVNEENSIVVEEAANEENSIAVEEVVDEENVEAAEKKSETEEVTALAETKEEEVTETSEWTAEDFTYTEMSHRLYGCDYSREFTVSGLAVAGFSNSGLKKLENNKNLVIPAKSPDGTKIMGVADDAFKNKGLTGLKLPQGAIVPYDDTVTHVVTQRGNFLIGVGAFSGNNLTNLVLPEGVIAVLSSAFKGNKLESVTIPHTVWWLENSCFASNNLSTVNFPKTCDFQMEMHAFAFAQNRIKSVRLPDYTMVVEKKVFYWNPGVESVPENAPSGEEENGGVVYMYTDNPNLANMERIHHIDRKSETQLSWHQKLIIGGKPEVDNTWTASDFTFDGAVVTGLSEAGLKKIKNDKELILPNSVKEIGKNAFAGFPIQKLTLPSRIQKIGEGAFSGNELKELSVPGSLKVIEKAAFAQEKSMLQTLTLGEGVEEIRSEAFAGSALEKVNLPDSLNVLDKDTFKREAQNKVILYTNVEKEYGESDYHRVKVNLGEWSTDDFTYEGTVVTGFSEKGILKSEDNDNLVIPDKTPAGEWVSAIADTTMADTDGVFGGENISFETLKLPTRIEKIGIGAFRGLGLTKVKFPETLKEIGAMAFHTNELEEIILPDSVKTLGQAAFMTNPTIKKLVLSNSLTDIPASAFGNAGTIAAPYTELIIPESVTSIKGTAFAGNSLKKLEIPASVKDIGSSAFANGEGKETLQELILHEGLEKINSKSFNGSALKTVNLPSTVTTLNKDAFKGNAGGKAVVYVPTMEQYNKFSPAAASGHIIKLMPTPWDTEDFTYEGTIVTGFSEKGLLKREDMKDLIIPDKTPAGEWVTAIGDTTMTDEDGVFGGENISFETLKLPAKIEKIGIGAFRGLGLKKVKFPETLKEIGAMAFHTNELEEVILPDSVEKLGNAAFITNPTIRKIVLSKSLTDIPASAFGNTGEVSAPYTELIIPESVTSIKGTAFAGNSLKKLEIPASVKDIGSSAFANGEGNETLQELILHEGLTKIGSNAFKSAALKSVDLPSTVTPAKNMNAKVFFANIYGDVILWVNDQAAADELNAIKNKTFTACAKNEFTFDGTVITGFSEAGEESHKEGGVLVLPRTTPTGEEITGIADAAANFDPANKPSGLFKRTSQNLFTEVVLPSGLEKIGNNAFQYSGVEKIVFPEGMKEIGNSAFQYDHIAEIILPDSVTTLGTASFMGNEELEKVALPKGITTIPASAFAVNTGVGAEKFTEIDIPDTVTSIGQAAFSGHHFKELVIPDSVKTIGRNSFMQNISDTGNSATLETVVLSKKLETIDNSAFANCKLSYVIIPGTLTKLTNSAFSNGANGTVWLYTANEEHLKETSNFKPTGKNNSHQVVYEDMLNHGWTFEDFTYDGSTITGWSEQGNITRKGNLNLVLPTVNPVTGEAITSIGDSAFRIPEEEWDQGHTGVESVNGMETVVIPETVTKIGANAFQYNNLVKVDFPKGLVSIGSSAFNSNKMEIVELPNSVTDMQSGAFSANNITEITLSKGLTKLESGVFSDNIRLTHVDIPDTITEIGDFAFSGDRLETLTIPKSVTKIGRAAFKLHHLTELTIPGNVKEIGESAFEGTYKAITLKNLTIEEGVEKIGKLAFRMGYLEKVILPNSIKELAPNAFKDNTGVDGVVLLYTKNLAHLEMEMDETCQKIVYLEEDKPEAEKPNPDNSGSGNKPDSGKGDINKGDNNKGYNNKGYNNSDKTVDKPSGNNKGVKTGDTTPILPYGVALAVSMAVMLVVLKKTIKRGNWH